MAPEMLINIVEIAALCSPALIRVPKMKAEDRPQIIIPAGSDIALELECSVLLYQPARGVPVRYESPVDPLCSYCGTRAGRAQCLNCGAGKPY